METSEAFRWGELSTKSSFFLQQTLPSWVSSGTALPVLHRSILAKAASVFPPLCLHGVCAPGWSLGLATSPACHLPGSRNFFFFPMVLSCKCFVKRMNEFAVVNAAAPSPACVPRAAWAGGAGQGNVPDVLPTSAAPHQQQKKTIACLLDTRECAFN